MQKKNDYLKIFLIATLFSSLGGILGYFIGSYFFDLGMVVAEFYNYEEKVINLKNNLSEGSGLYIWLATLFLAGFTPLPFKVFTTHGRGEDATEDCQGFTQVYRYAEEEVGAVEGGT